MRGPNVPSKMPTIIGPAAKPNFTGVAMPGNENGTDPKASPKTRPIKITTRLGSSRSLTAFPNTCSTFRIAAASPTTVNRSPNWSTNSGVASNSTPERKTRLILIP